MEGSRVELEDMVLLTSGFEGPALCFNGDGLGEGEEGEEGG